MQGAVKLRTHPDPTTDKMERDCEAKHNSVCDRGPRGLDADIRAYRWEGPGVGRVGVLNPVLFHF